MGLGDGPREADEYEWVRLADLPAELPGRGRRRVRAGEPAPAGAAEPPGDGAAGATPLAAALDAWLQREPLWGPGRGVRVLLVDLDNLRADPTRWQARMEAVVVLARSADHAVLAGQVGAVARARPHLAEFAPEAQAVPDGSDLADHVLLDAAAAVPGDQSQLVVLSNDGIFARLADRGPLTVLSPGGDALADRLRDAADRVVDLAVLEGAAEEVARAGRRGQRRRGG